MAPAARMTMRMTPAATAAAPAPGMTMVVMM